MVRVGWEGRGRKERGEEERVEERITLFQHDSLKLQACVLKRK